MDSYVKLITGNNFVIPKQTFQFFLAASGLTPDATLLQIANTAASLPRPLQKPVRGEIDLVGTAAITYPDEEVIVGTNLSTPPFNLCSEPFATALALTNGQRGFTVLASSILPCGNCRGMLSRFGTGKPVEIISPNFSKMPLTDLLPGAKCDYPGAIEPRFASMPPFENIQILDAAPFLTHQMLFDAYRAALNSYSPKFNSPSSLTLYAENRGQLSGYAGSFGELPWHNGGIKPSYGAIARLVAHGIAFTKVTHALFLGNKRAFKKHARAMKALCRDMFPKASFHHAYVKHKRKSGNPG